MNTKQMQAAKIAMIEWLSHPQELGKAPVKIECVGNIDLHEMTYYIFKYKKTSFGKWLLGVCGGYEGDGGEHCGHVYSEMEEYDEDSAVEKATEMIEKLRSYWMDQAKQHEERKAKSGTFVGFVLLSDAAWDMEQLLYNLKERWDIIPAEEQEKKDNTLIFSVGDMMVAASLMPAPVPNGEAEQNAKNNYMWPEAVDVAKVHKAHIMVAVLGKEVDLLERGKLYTKVVAACCQQKNAIGVYTSGVVFEPCYYEKLADMMKEDRLPIFNWIWFGLYRNENSVCCYTYGMDVFGKDEMEVLYANAEPSELLDFLSDLVAYVLEYDVTLNDGETIGFSEADKHAISRSKGISLPGMTLKIEF